MPTKQTAFIVVDKDWFNRAAIRHILWNGRESQSDGDTHLLIVGDPDFSDPRGIVIPGIETTAVLNRIDNSPVKMKFLVPWAFILGYGLSEEQASATARIGFTVNGVAATVVDANAPSEAT